MEKIHREEDPSWIIYAVQEDNVILGMMAYRCNKWS